MEDALQGKTILRQMHYVIARLPFERLAVPPTFNWHDLSGRIVRLKLWRMTIVRRTEIRFV